MKNKVRFFRVCYFGTYRQEYSRNRIMIEGLHQAGVDVIECHEPLWRGIEDRVQAASGGWLRPAFLGRVFKAYARLLRRYHYIKDYDILVVGYPGHYDVFIARWLSWMRHKPLVWDVLNSMYLIAVERGIAQRHGFTAALIRFLERMACRLPERLILDSQAFITWFQTTHQLKAERFWLMPIGSEDQMLRQETMKNDIQRLSRKAPFIVLYYGTYIPNHGVDIIVEAARRLQNDPVIQFEFVGDGPEKAKAVGLAKKDKLTNITFFDWLEKDDLALKIASCDVCLGTFGATLQASLTNNNKIFEGFAMQKAVISGASPALPDTLIHGEHLFLCERANPQVLAEAIQTLKNDPVLRKRLEDNGHRIFHEQFDVAHIGAVFATYLQELVSR
jgi:glycosyltransferase involved in cell wall biosynthesis